MYDSAAKITNNRVSTSIMFMGITPLCTRGHITSENRIYLSVQLYEYIIPYTEHLFKMFVFLFKIKMELNSYKNRLAIQPI